MIAADIFRSLPQNLHKGLIDLSQAFGPFFLRHLKRLQTHMVKPLRKAQQGCVALCPDRFQNPYHIVFL